MELKYIIFAIVVLGMIPALVALVLDRRLLRVSLIGLLLPLLNFEGTAINFLSMETYRGTSRGIEISLCYVVALVIILAIILKTGIKMHMPTLGGFLFFLYFIFSAFSILKAEDKIISLFELWKMLMMFLVYLAVFLYLEYSKGDFSILFYGLDAFIVLCFFFVLKQHYSSMNQVKSFFPHQNSMAMFLVLANVIPFSQFLNSRNEYKSWFFLFVFCCGAVSVLRTYSRGSFMTFPLSIAVTFFISTIVQFKARKVHRIILILILGIIGFLIFLPKIVLRFEQANKASKETRKQFVVVAINIIRDKVVFGVGLNNWSLTLRRHREYTRDRKSNELLNFVVDGIVETIYLLVAAECGLPCLIILLCWFMYYFLISLKLAFQLRHSRYFFIPAATAGGLLGIYAQSILEWVLKQSMNFIFLMIVFAMLSYLNRNCKMLLQMEKEEEEEKNKKAAEEPIDNVPAPTTDESSPNNDSPTPTSLPAIQ